MIKYCKDCKHFSRHESSVTNYARVNGWCRSENVAETDLINGGLIAQSAYDARYRGVCGTHAQYWEPMQGGDAE